VDTAARLPTAAVVVCSDRVSQGTATDTSGQALIDVLLARGVADPVETPYVVPDERDVIAKLLRLLADDDHAPALIVVTGGTGFAARDVTPEATRDVIERESPGLAEAMRAAGRAITPLADLSRGVCGVRGRTLILNVPGSERGAVESLEAVMDILPHALRLLAGNVKH